MALAKRSSAHANENGKRHGSHSNRESWPSTQSKMRVTTLIRKRRIVLIIALLVSVYLFVHYLPTDVPSVGQRIDSRTGLNQGRLPFDPRLTHEKQHNVDNEQTYDGPVKFYQLASSLRMHSQNRHGYRQNVLFVLYELSSAATILNIACAMARYDRNDVHVGLVAVRDDTIEQIMAINGLSQEDCPIFWHDGRPDHNARSSTGRRATAIKAALTHMHSALQYSVALIDQPQAASSMEKVVRSTFDSLWVPLHVLSKSGMDWVAALDGHALKVLSSMQIDISIQPYRHSSGSLVRLLESIRNADYGALPRPRIIVDIPYNIDTFALRYLENFRWPRDSRAGQSQLILRRHLDTSPLTPAQAATRTLESFYPPSQPLSHILVLSPDIELAPNYFHFLLFTTLEYKYGLGNQQSTRMAVGISLDLPNLLLDETNPFVAQKLFDAKPLLLHQGPTSTATLWFGDKWIELQDYASLRLERDPEFKKRVSLDPVIPASHPAWLRIAAEYMRAGNYFMIYPSFARTPDTRLAIKHNEVAQRPEEYWVEPTKPASTSIPALQNSTVLTSNDDSALASDKHEEGLPSRSILALIGLKDFSLPPVDLTIPLVSFTGHPVEDSEALDNTRRYTAQLSLDVGGCVDLEHRDASKVGSISHMFC